MLLKKKPTHDPGLRTVFTSQGHMAAQVAKSKLECAGIPAILSYDTTSLLFGLTVDGLGEVRVMVPEACAEEAGRVLAEVESTEPQAGDEGQAEAR